MRHRTLPPPEWTGREGPRSAVTLQLERITSDPPISRHTGPRAELAFYRSRVDTCARAGDPEGERDAATGLARALAARGAELDTATKLARRALLLGDDSSLREELAQWFSILGEPSLAAATLRPLLTTVQGSTKARLLTRIGVLLGRGGNARGAADALFEAAREDPTDSTAPELLGGIGAWAQEAVSAERAAEAYLEGARRREASGDRASAFEDLLRSFELAPGEADPAERLAKTLMARGRIGAADEVIREHARASADRGRGIHLARMRDALNASDVPRALGAALDAKLDADIGAERFADSPEAKDSGFHALLERAGLFELLAAHLELAAESLTGRDRARVHVELGRIYEGPLLSPDRAVRAWTEALVAEPGNERARTALVEHAADERDSITLLEGLLQCALAHEIAPGLEVVLREVAEVAEQRLDAPMLSAWAFERLAALGDAGAEAELRRVEPRARERRNAVAALRDRLEATSGDARRALLVELVALSGPRPGAPDEEIAALREIVALSPASEAAGWRLRLERVLTRAGRWEELATEYRVALAAGGGDPERVRLGLARLRRRRGDLDGALEELAPLLGDPGARVAVWSMALVVAARLDDSAVRARALLRLAGPLAPSLRAVLSSVAAESLLDAGDIDPARAAAEQARHADPSLARPVGVLAAVALRMGPDRAAAEALERAMGVIVPRAALCEALAEAHEALGEPGLSLAWTQRWLALRPGDPRAARTLLGRVTETGDAARLADALSWLLSQPQPLREMSSAVGAALLRLAELDAPRAAGLARRALDVLGPRAPEIADTVLAVADVAEEPGLAIAVIERSLAAGGDGDRSARLLELARRRRASGDADGAARALARAALEGAPPKQVLEALSDALPARSSDGELSLLEARAEALSGLDGAAISAAAHAFRELGAARWDLAGDHDGAVRAWSRAARLDADRGVARLARDLVSFAGYQEAIERLEQFAGEHRDPKEASAVFTITAMIALSAGAPETALRLAALALDLDSSRADVLAIAERAATREEDLEVLERVYSTLSKAALGCYGERAVHYRAARNLERRGHLELALGHAVRAFEAVPSEGITFVVMSRLGERVDDSSEIVRAIERVASREKLPAARAEWLRRAAAISGTGEEGARQRVEVLLRALAVQPAYATVVSLGAAFSQLIERAPDARDISEMRFARAVKALEQRLEGPDGARIGIAAAVIALGTFDSPELALEVLGSALGADASVDEYGEMIPRAPRMARAVEPAKKLLARIIAVSEDRYGNAGRAMLELGAALAAQLQDGEAEARLLVAAAHCEPEDTELVRRATVAAQRSGQSELLASVIEAVPSAARLAGLLDLAREAEKQEDLASAIDALERVLSDEAADEDSRRVVRDRLRELYGRAGRRDELERLLVGDLEREDIDPVTRGRITRELAALVAARGDPERALTILSRMATALPDDIGLLEDTVTLARQAGDKRRRADALSRLVDLVAESEKLPLLRELAPLLDELKDEDTALVRYNEVLARAPRDLDALAALERDAERRGDWERLVEVLGRRASLASRVDDVRHIRLRRATVLEQRLGRSDEALAELDALVATTGDNLSVLRVLADLNERLGAPLRAAQLWMRASAVATERREAADLALRAAAAHLDGGDVGSARRVLEGLEAWAEPTARFLELRVEVERHSDDPRALAVALDELASLSPGSAEEKAALLVESARAFDRVGDADEALARAERASVHAPREVEPQLVARWLEYKSRGPGNTEDARATITELRGIEDAELTPAQAELRGFLLAEALDVGVGPGAGMRELSRVEAAAGRRPLIALAIAERLVAGGEPAPALELFDAALGGDLRGLRSRGQVALMAARAAHEVGDAERAQRYVEIAASDGALLQEAQALSAEIRAAHRSMEGTPSTPERRSSTPPPRTLASSAPPKPGKSLAEAAPPKPARPPKAEPATDQQKIPKPEARRRSEPPAPRTISEIPPPLNDDPRAEPDTGEHAAERSPSSRPPLAVDMPGAEPLRPSRVFPAVSVGEQKLLEELTGGNVNAGIELMNQLENRSSRSHDLVNVARRVVALVPGDTSLLRRLYEAALGDKNIVYARALEHALSIFDRSVAPVRPPALLEQPEDPEPVRALLFRDIEGTAAEALALVWEGAAHVFRRDPSTYGVTGLERVPLGAPTPLGRIYSGVARALGVSRTPLFQRRSAGPVTLSVALLAPPAVIVAGEVTRESPALAFHLGAMLAAALPEHVLMFGTPESQTRGILKGLALAFGRPLEDKSGLTAIANLAEVLWESIPPRAQRRLREICDDPTVLGYDAALVGARRSVRRAGLFACGDLATALRETLADEELDEHLLDEPDGPTRLSRHEAVADLVRLATSMEYAQVRWQPGRGRNRQSSGSWATF